MALIVTSEFSSLSERFRRNDAENGIYYRRRAQTFLSSALSPELPQLGVNGTPAMLTISSHKNARSRNEQAANAAVPDTSQFQSPRCSRFEAIDGVHWKCTPRYLTFSVSRPCPDWFREKLEGESM